VGEEGDRCLHRRRIILTELLKRPQLYPDLACLYDLPPSRKSWRRGRPRKYGKNIVNLAKRAKDKRGWEEIEIQCRGKLVTRRVKTFLVTSKLAVGSVA
jgi:hypothetical protein